MSKVTIYYFSTKTRGTVHISVHYRGRALCGLLSANHKGIMSSDDRGAFGPMDCLSCLRAKERGAA